MIITALKDFGMDLSDPARTAEFAERIPHSSESRLEVDLSGCILDYPATSKIIDVALQRLNEAAAPRELVLMFNIAFQERMFMKWFFFGGALLPAEYHKLDEPDLRGRVNEALRERKMTVTVRIVDPRGGAATEPYTYG